MYNTGCTRKQARIIRRCLFPLRNVCFETQILDFLFGFLTLFPTRENVGFHPPDAEPSVRSCTPHRSPARDLRALTPLVGALSTVLRPPSREVASSLSTHERKEVSMTPSSSKTIICRDRGGSRAREGGRVAERGQCLSGRWCEPAPGHRRRAAPPVSS